jgi:hypothetical protein
MSELIGPCLNEPEPLVPIFEYCVFMNGTYGYSSGSLLGRSIQCEGNKSSAKSPVPYLRDYSQFFQVTRGFVCAFNCHKTHL